MRKGLIITSFQKINDLTIDKLQNIRFIIIPSNTRSYQMKSQKTQHKKYPKKKKHGWELVVFCLACLSQTPNPTNWNWFLPENFKPKIQKKYHNLLTYFFLLKHRNSKKKNSPQVNGSRRYISSVINKIINNTRS